MKEIYIYKIPTILIYGSIYSENIAYPQYHYSSP